MSHLFDRFLPAASLALGLSAALAGCGSSSSDPVPTVSSPSAGAAWSGTRTIRWSGFGDAGSVAIDLSSDGGTSYSAIVASTANDGSFDWDSTVEADGPTYRIRVRGGDRAARSGVFLVDNTLPTAVLDSPNGGGLVGATSTITWTTTDTNPGTVQLRASADGGANFDLLIASAAPDSGSFAWDATGLADGTSYRVQVTPRDRAGNVGAPDASDTDFELDRTAPLVALTAPLGGETWTGTQSITWITTDTNPGTVDVLASTNGGSSFGEVIATGAADTGTFPWQTGTVPDSTTLRVRVVATDAAGNVGTPAESGFDFAGVNLRLTGTAHYRDANGSAVIDAGDELYLRFDKPIAINAPTVGDFALPKAGDSLGTGASFAIGDENNSLCITLGANPVLRVRGRFDAQNTSTAAPSGLDLFDPVTPNAIESLVGGIDAAPIGAIDLIPQAIDLPPLAGSTSIPRRGAVGDLDADGDLDLVVAVTGGAPSERWTGDGNQGWVQSQLFDADNTRDVAIGDVDRDGDLDVVTAVYGANKVWLNDGSGALLDSGQALGTRNSDGVALADFDQDGDLDAFFANAGGGQSNRVWFNDGSGVFIDSGQALGGANSVALAVGDFHGDGLLDVLVANNNTASRLWRNVGGGLFQAGPTITLTQAQDVALGDLDGDGDLDVFISVLGQNQVVFNDGAGTFPGAIQLVGNNDNRGVVLLDLDGDGDLDAMTAKNLDSGVYFLNDGSGLFTVDSVDSRPDDAVDVVAGRLEADSDVDFIILNRLGAYRPYRGSVSGGQPLASYSPSALTLGAWQSGRGAAGDVDGDGRPDLVVPDVAGSTQVLLGDGAGGFTLGAAFGGAGATGGDLVDVDQDGDLDYVQRSGAPGVVTDRLWLNAMGVFSDSGLTLGLETHAAGDLDGDGDEDLIVVTATAVETWDGDGAGSFAPSGQSLALAGVTDVTVGDLDGDGDLDLVASSATDLDLLQNDGAGALTVAASIAIAGARDVVLADLDRDGDLDVLAASPGGAGNVEWSRNDGGFTFAAAAASFSGSTGLTQILALDYDEDGDVDLFAVDAGLNELYVATGNGDGTFQATTPIALGDLASVTWIDADGDGDPDLYASIGDDGSPSSVADQLLILD